MTDELHDLELAVPVDAARAAVAAVADDWGAEWSAESGRLLLPVMAGLRRGVLEARLNVRTAGSSRSSLSLRGETCHWRVHRPAAAVLVMGGLGALPVLLWPLSSQLLSLAPVGLVFMFLAWFMVVSRLRTAGAAEFLGAVQARAAGIPGPPDAL